MQQRHQEDGSGAGESPAGSVWPRASSSFAARVFWTLIPIVLLLLIVMGVTSYQQNRRLVEEQFIKRGEEMARSLAYGSELGVLSEDPQLLESSLRAVVTDPDVAYALLYREDGELLERGGPQLQSSGPGNTLREEDRLRLVRKLESFHRPAGDQFVEFLAPIVSEGAETPDELLLGLSGASTGVAVRPPRSIGFVRLGLTRLQLQQNSMAILQLWGGLTIGFLALSTLAIYAFARRVTRPINTLTDHARRIANGLLDLEIPVESRDEIGQLAASFNEMARALKRNIGERERLMGELQDLNRTLEERIERRTSQLQDRTEELERSLEQVEALGEITRAVSSSLDLDEVLDAISRYAVTLSGSDACGIFEIDLVRGTLVVLAAHNLSSEEVKAIGGHSFRVEGTLKAALESGEPLQLPDVAASLGFPLRAITLRAGFRSLLAIPMGSGDKVSSLVLLRKAAGDFDKRTTDLLVTLASHSMVALAHADLFRELDAKGRELEAASRHKSEFLANMSHELRTPLNAIIGFSEVLLERLFGELVDKQDEYLRDIHSSGHHLLSLINDILDLAKVEAGRVELELEKFDLPLALENAMTLIKERAGRHEISLSLQVDPALGELLGDQRKVKQVLVNLLSNAVKFTHKGGQISVRAVLVDQDAVISITDTGVGIARKDQEIIFEEFRQVGRHSERSREGTGLGLTLSRRFVELHGGRLGVESEPGVGSTFTFTLPLQALSASRAQQQ